MTVSKQAAQGKSAGFEIANKTRQNVPNAVLQFLREVEGSADSRAGST